MAVLTPREIPEMHSDQLSKTHNNNILGIPLAVLTGGSLTSLILWIVVVANSDSVSAVEIGFLITNILRTSAFGALTWGAFTKRLPWQRTK